MTEETTGIPPANVIHSFQVIRHSKADAPGHGAESYTTGHLNASDALAFIETEMARLALDPRQAVDPATGLAPAPPEADGGEAAQAAPDGTESAGDHASG